MIITFLLLSLACTPSTYKSTLSNTACTSCPLNSDSTAHGSSVCQCDSTFYRAPNDGPAAPCTGKSIIWTIKCTFITFSDTYTCTYVV